MTDLTHLRQTASLAEFNVRFDSIAAKLNLPEDYLVDAYIGALRDEIADSVRLFNLRTLLEARRLARVQEIGVNRKNAKITSDRAQKPYSNGLVASSSIATSDVTKVTSFPGNA